MKKTSKILMVILLITMVMSSMTNIAQAYLLNATDAIGQLDTAGDPVYTTQTADDAGLNGLVFQEPIGIDIDTTNHRLFVPDRKNNRVLVFNLNTSNQLVDWAADYVLGQLNFSSSTGATTQIGLNNPRYLAYDSTNNRLFVNDYSNHRVIVYDVAEITNGEAAINVLGQTDFESSGMATTQNGLNYTYGLDYDNTTGYLYVTDGDSGNRVMVFDVNEIIDGEDAINVLGQADFESAVEAESQSGMRFPHDVVVDETNGYLYVADTSNHRVTVFDINEIIDNEDAIKVLGQTGFDLRVEATTQSGMKYPYGLTLDSTNQRLFVADTNNNRVLVYSVAEITNGEPAIKVLGQTDFETDTAATTQSGLSSPEGLSYNSSTGELYVGDASNHRVIIFNTAEIEDGENATNLLGHNTRGGVANWTYSTADKVGDINDVGLDYPDDSLLDPIGHRLFQSDQNNSRILVFNLDSNNNLIDKYADYVLGQSNFFSSGVVSGQSGFKWQHNMILDQTTQRLFVADSYNERIMVFDVTSITNGENAINILGQPDFTTYSATTTQTGMDGPRGFAFDTSDSRLFVADRDNNRILVYDASEITNTQPAINVLGQADFTSSSATTTITGLDVPYELDLDQENQRLFVADKENNRVVVYDVSEITDGEPAVNVLGQANFTANIDSTGGDLAQDVLLKPRGLVYDSVNDWLFVVEYTGHRVMVYDVSTIIDGEDAINVLGQANFTAGYTDENGAIQVTATQSNFWFPETVEIDETNRKLYVSDMNHNRIAIFQLPKITSTSLANGTTNTAYSQAISAIGGTEPYTCSLASGTLPAGLTLNANCTITGTPTTAGTSSFTVRASDATITAPETVGFWHDKSLSLTIVQEALAITNVTATLSSIEITFNQPILSTTLTAAQELGDATNSAGDLRNYSFKIGSPLVAKTLSRGAPYNMTTEYFAAEKKLRIYGIENLYLSTEDPWQFQVAADTIKHATENTYVVAYLTTGTIGGAQDPVISYIKNDPSAVDPSPPSSGCANYPCGAVGDGLTIVGTNFTASTIVYIDGTSVTINAQTATELDVEIPSVSSTGNVSVQLYDPDTGRYSTTKNIVVYDSTVGVVVGSLTLADTTTGVDNAEITVDMPYYYGSGGTAHTFSNGYYAVPVITAGTYEVRFTTPPGISESAPSKVSNLTVTLGAITSVGAKACATATISGYVCVPDSDPCQGVEGVNVRVYTYDWTVEQQTVTNTDGSWSAYIDNTASQINVGIETTPSYYHTNVLGYFSSLRGIYDQTLAIGTTVTNVEVYLTQYNVGGTVKTPIGDVSGSNPVPNTVVPNANVQLRTEDWSYEQWTSADDNGVFKFGGVPAGSTYILEIEPPWSGDFSAYARTRIEDLIVGSSATGWNASTSITDLNQDAKAVSGALRFGQPNVWGTVKAGGLAVENAWVELHNWGGWYSTNTDADGNFKLDAAIGTYELEIRPSADSSYSQRRFENISITSATSNDLAAQADVIDGIDDDAFTLAAPNVSGYVYGPTGTTGQANVGIDLCPYSAPGMCYFAMSNNSGVFGLGGVPDGTWRVQIRPDTWSTIYVAPAEKILVISSGSPTTLDGSVISGDLIFRLVDPSDGGLTGKVCAPGDTSECENPQANVGVNLRTQNAMEGFRWGQTDSNGQFAFGAVTAGVYDLEVEPWGSADYSRKTFTVTVNSDDSVTVGSTEYSERNINLYLSTPNITGYIYTPKFAAGHTSTSNPTPDQPVQWAWVNLHQEGPMMGPGGWYGASTDENGAFKFGGVQPGSNYVLEAEAQWGGAYAVKRYTNITFTDLDADGVADECNVGETDDGNPTNASCDLSRLLGTTVADGDPAYAVRVGIPNLRGQIVNPDGSTGVQNCWVMVHDTMWMNQAGGNTDQNGYFNLGGLSDGTYQIEINMPWGGEQAYTAPSGLTVVIANDIATVKRNNVALTNNKITLTTPQKILTGYVYKDINSDGDYDIGVDTAMENVRVEGHRDMGGGFFETRTNSSGEYTLKLSEGAWWIQPMPDWGNVNVDWVYSEPPTRLTFPLTSTEECKGTTARCTSASATATKIADGLDFKVDVANCTLTGYVKTPDGTAVANTWVDAHRGMGPGNGANTDSNGRFSIKVPAGTYEIMAMPNTSDYGSPDPIKVKVADTQTTDAGTLYLKSRSSHIKGSVTDSAGNAIGNVMVNAMQFGSPGWGMGFTDSTTGRYDITVSSGTWNVMLMPMSGNYIYQGAPLNVTVDTSETSDANDFVLKNADTTLKVSVVDAEGTRITDFWGGVWVKDTSVDDMIDFGGPMEDMMMKGDMITTDGAMMEGGMGGGSAGGGGGAMGPGMEQGGFQGGGLVNGYTEIKIPGGSEASPEQYELGLHTPPGATYTLSATEIVDVVSGTDQEIELVVTENDVIFQGHLYIDADSDGKYDSGEEISGLRAFINGHRADGGWQMTETNSDGSYSLLVCAGEWYLDAWIDVMMTFGSSKYMIINEDIRTTGNTGDVVPRNFEVKELNSSISGTVTDPDGVAMDNVWIFVDYGTQEMISDFKGSGGPGVGVFTDISGDYTLNVAAGTYKVGAGIPPWDSRELISPDLLTATVAASASSTGNDLQFKASDATITGTITYAGTNKAAYIRAWSDDGGGNGTISTDGTYSLNVSSGDTWHVSAATEISNVFYESTEASVTTVAGANTQNLVLVESALSVPESKTSSFDSANSKSLILGDGLKVEAPAGSIQSSGTVTLTVTPKTDSKPDSKDKPIGVSYDFVAKDANGQAVTSFANDVTITIPYNESVITAAGYSETDLRPKYYDETTGTWENWKAVVQDTINNTFTITTDHFTPGSLTGGRVTAAAVVVTPVVTGTSSSAGSSSPLAYSVGPTNVSTWINWGAETTVSRTVTLSLNADNATEMLISNSGDFAGATWEEYKTSKYWTLESGNGEKNVYVKYRDEDYNESSIVSDNIILAEVLAEAGERDLIKTADSSGVYLILNGKRHVFPHFAVYQSWAYPEDFSTVKTVSSADFNTFAEGDPVPFKDGSMFRGTSASLHGKSASAVFYVEDNKLRAVNSGEVYQSLFNDPSWSLVTWVPDDLLSKFEYTLGENLILTDIHPNGTLVKYADSAAVYLIENGKKRQFNSWDAVVDNGYRSKKIHIIPASEIYVTADSIGSLAESLTTPVIAAMY